MSRREIVTAGLALGCAGCAPAGGRARAGFSAGARTLRLAVAQMSSVNGDIAGNLARATLQLEAAAASGAQLVLFPELMPGGYSLAYDAWDSAEPADGPTVQWLKGEARRLRVWIGTSFLEASGADFFDAFALAAPDGDIAGVVRKQAPASAEGFFFKGEAGPHVIDTSIGRIGVGICFENYLSFLPRLMVEHRADLILMPFSFPDTSGTGGGGLASPPGTHVANWYARRLGLPVAMTNKVGAWRSHTLRSPTDIVTGVFPGGSAIVDGDGSVRTVLGGQPGFGVATVHLDPAMKARSPRLPSGQAIDDLIIGGPMTRLATRVGLAWQELSHAPTLGDQAARTYASNPKRAARALAISSRRTAA